MLTAPKTAQEEDYGQGPKFKQYSAEDFYKTTAVFGSSINHDASAVLISSDESGIFNVYKMPLDGSPAQALTNSTQDSVFAESWFPNPPKSAP